MIRLLCVLATACAFALPADVQSEAAPADASLPLLSSRMLRVDAAVLRSAYEQLHPGLLRYNTRDDLDRRDAELDRALDHDQTVLDAFVAFTRYTAGLRCGHSYPNFTNQPRAIADLLKSGDDRLPFEFVWIDGRMVVTRNLSDQRRLVRGTIVEAIDGVASDRILADLLPLARADGHNDAKRIDSLQLQGTERFEAFDVYFALLHPKTGSGYDLQTSAGRFVLAGLSYDSRLAAKHRTPAGGDGPLGWSLTFVRPDVALMTMPTWVAYNDPWDWKAWLASAFDTMVRRGTRHLVIDLRGNEGGSSVGDEIAAYLVTHDTDGVAIDRRTTYRRVPDVLRPVLDTWDPSFFDWGDAAIGPDANGFYRLTRYDEGSGGTVIRPRAPHFDGQVDVLVDASNSSATFEFAELVQSHGLARLVGAQTGGNLRGINGGAFFFLRLPGSRIEVDVPLIGQFPWTAMPDRGLQPDIVATPTQADVAAGTDVALDAALGGDR